MHRFFIGVPSWPKRRIQCNLLGVSSQQENMMMRTPFAVIAHIFAWSVAVVPFAAHAQESDPPVGDGATRNTGPIVVEGERDPGTKKICRRETTTGSIRVRTVCRTRQQMKDDEEAAEVALELMLEKQKNEEFVKMQKRDGRP